MRSFTLHFDGASKGNPGPAGIGGVILDDEGKTHEVKKAIGIATNNQAEYLALIETLKQAHALGGEVLQVFADSELVVRQMTGVYQVKDMKLIPLYKEAAALARSFKKVTFRHVPREMNKEADSLANLAVNDGRKESSLEQLQTENEPLHLAITQFLDVLSELSKKNSRIRVRCEGQSLQVHW